MLCRLRIGVRLVGSTALNSLYYILGALFGNLKLEIDVKASGLFIFQTRLYMWESTKTISQFPRPWHSEMKVRTTLQKMHRSLFSIHVL